MSGVRRRRTLAIPYFAEEGVEIVKHLVVAFALAIIGAALLLAESSIPSQNSPKAIVETLVQLQISGQLLTTDGRHRASLLFAHTIPAAREGDIVVVGNDYSLREIWTRGNHAEVLVTYKDFGSIDSSLRYRPPDASSSKRVVRYELILKLTGNSQLEGAGGRQWRIESPQRNICVALDAAIAHVTAARDKTTDPKVNKNAQITLAQLRKFQR